MLVSWRVIRLDFFWGAEVVALGEVILDSHDHMVIFFWGETLRESENLQRSKPLADSLMGSL